MNNQPKVINTKVSGVTFEGRQALIAQLSGREPCRLEPEPTNKYDPNAIAVKVAHGADIWHIGYIPRGIAAEIAPYLEGESLICQIEEITGGFETSSGDIAALGVRLQIELPGEIDIKQYEPHDRHPGQWE